MKSDALLVNKIAAAVLVSGLLAMVVGELSGALIHTGETMPIEEQAFVIAEPSDADSTVAEAEPEAPAGPADILPMLASADVAEGEKFSRKCSACHSFDEGGPAKVGPNLYNIVNASIGSADGYSYSGAMAEHGGEWDYAALNEFLYNPKAYVPGTKMSYKGISDDEDRANMIAYLRSLSGNPAPLP